MKGTENRKSSVAARKNGASKSHRQEHAAKMAAALADPKPVKGGKPGKDAGKKGKKNKDSKPGKKVQAAAGHKPKGWEKHGIPVETKVSNRDDGSFASVKIFGHSLTSVLRAAGRAEYTPSQMRIVCDQIGLAAVRINQIRDKVSRCEIGTPAPLSRKEFSKFDALIKAGTKGKEDIE